MPLPPDEIRRNLPDEWFEPIKPKAPTSSEIIGMASVQASTEEYRKLEVANPRTEPCDLLRHQWNGNFTKAKLLEIVADGEEFSNLFACLPRPINAEMMAMLMAGCLVEDFTTTALMSRWRDIMNPVLGLRSTCDSDRLNQLFRAYNPTAYQEYLDQDSRTPFLRDELQRQVANSSGWRGTRAVSTMLGTSCTEPAIETIDVLQGVWLENGNPVLYLFTRETSSKAFLRPMCVARGGRVFELVS